MIFLSKQINCPFFNNYIDLEQNKYYNKIASIIYNLCFLRDNI